MYDLMVDMITHCCNQLSLSLFLEGGTNAVLVVCLGLDEVAWKL